ncbi:outer membrane protein assembly factor BamB family protein [Streptodolium elevatio]
MRDLEPGDPHRLGDHELVGVLGAGGFGRVFMARTPQGRRLAVKLTHPHLLRADPDFAMRFAGVMGDLSRVRNLGAGRIVEWSTDGVRPWYARRYVPGASLVEVLAAAGPLPHAALRIVAGVARGLAAMHDAELPHGGVTPGNVLVTATTAQLVDGGLARVFGGPGQGGAQGALVPLTGPAFAPPEGADATLAADVYALGVLLLLCARGHLPEESDAWGGKDVSAAGLPDGVAPLAARLLHPVPESRPTVAEIVAQLGRPVGELATHLPRAARRAIGAHAEPAGSGEPPIGTALATPRPVHAPAATDVAPQVPETAAEAAVAKGSIPRARQRRVPAQAAAVVGTATAEAGAAPNPKGRQKEPKTPRKRAAGAGSAVVSSRGKLPAKAATPVGVEHGVEQDAEHKIEHDSAPGVEHGIEHGIEHDAAHDPAYDSAHDATTGSAHPTSPELGDDPAATAGGTATAGATSAEPAEQAAALGAQCLWTREIPGVQSLFMSDGLVFAGGESLVALAPETGEPVWSKPGWRIVGEPRGGRVYVTQGTRIALLDAITGAERWRTDVAAARGLWARGTSRLARAERAFRLHAVFEPAEGVLAAIGGHTELFGLDPASGELLWNRREARRTAFTRDDAGAVYLSGDGREPMRALDPRTGELLWRDDAEDSIVTAVDRGWVLCARFRPGTAEVGSYVVRAAEDGGLVHRDISPGDTAILENGVLYVLGGGEFRALRPAQAAQLWSIPWSGGTAGLSLAVDSAEAYLRGEDRRVHAVDLADGSVRWTSGPIPARRPLDAVGGQLDRTLPVLADGPVVCVRSHSDSVLIVLDRTHGRELWWWRAWYGTLTMVAPVVSGAFVYVVDGDRVRALTGRDTDETGTV